MSDQTIETKKPFANPEGSNAKQKEIARLRNVALDEQESPTERLAAATRLLSRYGPSKRNVVVINSVVKLFIEGYEYSITERAQKLKTKLVKARGLKEVVDVELPDEKEELVTDAPAQALVAGTSASDVPKAAFSLNEVMTAYEEVLGSKWRLLSEGAIKLTQEEKTKLLKAVLGDSPNVQSVRNLYDALHMENSTGWTIVGSCAEIGRIAEEFLKAQGVVIEEEQKEPDGFQRGLIDPQAAIDRVVAVGYKKIPKGASDSNLLQAALGDVPLDEKSVGQLWLTLGYWFKEVFGGAPAKGSEVMSAASRWILACICGYANPRHIKIVSPSVFTFEDDAAFRS